MVKIRLFDWKVGLNTVHAIKALREKAGCPLDEAMSIVNSVLDRKETVLELPNQNVATELIAMLTSMGMMAELVQRKGRRLQKHAT